MRLTSTPDGLRWVVERDIDAPVEAVWEALTDTGRWPEWGPLIADVESSTRHVEEGTTGRVRFQGTVVPVRFEVREVSDGPLRWTWDLARVFGTGHRVEPRSGGARVGFELPLAATGTAPVAARACENIAKLLE